MTFEELKLAIQRDASCMSSLGNTMAGQYLLKIHRFMLRKREWSFFESTAASITLVAGTSSYSLPTDNRTIQQVFVRDSNGTEIILKPIDDVDWIERINSTSDSGDPCVYRLTGGKIEIGQTPDTNAVTKYTSVYLQYIANPDNIDATHDSPWPSDDYDDCLIAGAAAMLAKGFGDKTLAPGLGSEFQAILRELVYWDATQKGIPKTRVKNTVSHRRLRGRRDYGRRR